MVMLSIGAFAMAQQHKQAPLEVPTVPLPVVADSVVDSVVKPRWTPQRTAPRFVADLDTIPLDLRMPRNIALQVDYDDTANTYVVGQKMGGRYLTTPLLMSPDEYGQWSLKRRMGTFFRQKNAENVATKGKNKFDFADMHFDLGPADKIFGPGGVRIKMMGTAELKLGGNIKNIDNPSLPVRNRRTKSIDFDEKINLNVTGKVGDKLNMNLNYNTDATFDFDTKNIKLRYEGKEDEIIKLIEAGNITFPSQNSLIKGASSLFGVRTDMQFGRLKLQTVFSQKKSSTTSVSSKGGVQLTPFEINVADYEENRHFFLAQYFRERYDAAMQQLPNLTTGIQITRVEVWVTNKTGTTANTRNIIALADLGESRSTRWGSGGTVSSVPANTANGEYQAMTTDYVAARQSEQTTTVLDGVPQFTGGSDYEKLSSARLLNSSEYTVNSALGYISLHTTLQPDQVLAVAFEYTSGGRVYQVGEFASDHTNTSEAIFVKSLKNTSNHPMQPNWRLMMKNVYYLASQVERTKFRLDIKYQSDTTGVWLNYIPVQQVKDTPLLRVLGCDRLDNNNRPNSNGYFDYVEDYTVGDGRVFLPAVEPFGQTLRRYLTSHGVSADEAERYVFAELYDTTRTAARQMAEKNKYMLVGQYRGTSANVISLGAYNVPQGSVVVTAGGVVLTEGSDYSVDYAVGEVTILNQNIIDAGTNVNVSLESDTDYGMQRKTMLGLNWQYDVSKALQLGGTLQYLTEQPLTSKVTMGSEPLRNMLWGLNINWRQESQWLTNMLNRLPFLHCTKPSQLSFTGEFAQLLAGQAGGTQSHASYIDDFENAKNGIDVSDPKAWVISSVPSMFPEHADRDSVTSGFNRALLAWYNIDPIFTYRSSSLTPSHIKSDLQQLSNHYVRSVYVSELYPNRQQSTYSGVTATLPILDLAYYPEERGAYNLTTDLTADGHLRNPQQRWGGMMRRLDTNDFETANIEYVEFWLLDPFIYADRDGGAADYGGDLYINLGEVSEDVLRDGKKFSESNMPVDGQGSFIRTAWGKVPQQPTETYAFATTAGARLKQDVGLNGLTDEEERSQPAYVRFLEGVQVNDSVRAAIHADPANDNYHFYRGRDYDERKTSILERYKRINMPQGNSPDSDSQTEGYDTSYKTTPDVEDINQDYTLNEYERYYQYRVSIRPEDMRLGYNHITDIREATVPLRNGTSETVRWYQFRIPLSQYDQRVGNINDFTSIRFMRMFLTQFRRPVVLRFGSLDLVRGEWRIYQQPLTNGATTGTIEVSAVNIEENNDKRPVNYVLPPGISRVTDPSQPQLVEDNEQAMNLVVRNLAPAESKAVYKNTMLDLRRYRHLQMFVHANHLIDDATDLQHGDLAVFVRLGSDYKNNYYEYEIPLTLTPDRNDYNKYSIDDRRAVWPEANMLDVNLSDFTRLKRQRNKSRAQGGTVFTQIYSEPDASHTGCTVSILGNPSLGEVRTLMIGVRNKSGTQKSGEVWVNELRLRDFNDNGGWAVSGAMNMQLSDVGTVNVSGRMMTSGFGGLEESVLQRSTDDYKTYSVTASIELGRFFPDKAKVSAPLYYSVTKEETRPKYNPLDTDLTLDEALDAAANKQERDSIERIAVTRTTNTNLSLSNVRVGIRSRKAPMPYDPANFSFSYSHSHRQTSGETTVYEKEDQWRGAFNYVYEPVVKPWVPFRKIKGRSQWAQYPRQLGVNWLPQSISFNTEMLRNYYELQERDMESIGGQQLPLTFSQQFLWNREFAVRWDLTQRLHLDFQSATHAQIEEPYTPVNKDLYPEQYQAWKDSVWQSIRRFGEPLDYQQRFSATLQWPLSLLPVFDWVTGTAKYDAHYSWLRGTELDDGTSLGHTITTNRQVSLSATFNMETLYNHVPFLRRLNQQRAKWQTVGRQPTVRGRIAAKRPQPKSREERILPKNQGTWQREVRLSADTVTIVTHDKATRRLIVTARTRDGRTYPLRYKLLDRRQLRIDSRDTATILLSVAERPPLDRQWWYRSLQSATQVLMMVRSASLTYRDDYSLSVPGFLPTIGDVFGQRGGHLMAPGLAFAFGTVDDTYVSRALDRGWLLTVDSIASPATANHTTDLQLRAVLEPLRGLRIDLHASRTHTRARTIQYMYSGMPTTLSGSFSMTTLSLKSALESTGSATGGYRSASFSRFCRSLEGYRQRAAAAYGSVPDAYHATVMIPAFLSAYTSSGGSGSFFPSLASMLPNWTVRYTGLSALPWVADHFKSITLSHAYRSIYAVGSYSATNAATLADYSVPTVSLNEAFSPLLGIDVSLHNDLSVKLEYRTTRIVSLSTTSVQINESRSNDWVLGMAYTISDFNLFGTAGNRRVSRAQRSQRQQPDSQKSVKTGVNHDLSLRLDLSLRRQASLSRDIATATSAANSGNTALRLSFVADYTLSRLLTLSAYYDRQTNTPLLSSASYPTTTHDFGLSLKVSLSR
ncbi:cell surface protein SprA [Prevotella sp. P3-120]|nr:cell surface protein SprA [Prevotella sp. P3-92]OYP52114.1 cell surface protein SprA [Prevotella sp. P3-120]